MCITAGHIFHLVDFVDVDVFGFFANFYIQNIEYMDIEKVIFYYY